MGKLISKLSSSCLFLIIATISVHVSAQQYPDPERNEEAIQRFEEHDRMNPPPIGSILLTGSSSITRWNDQAKAALAPLTVIPRGFGGSIMHDIVHYLDRVALNYKPRAILIYEGDNDTGVSRYGLTPDMILGDFKKIVARIHDELPETRIYVLAVKPSVLREKMWGEAQKVSAGYRVIAKSDPLVHYIDVATPFLLEDGTVMRDVFVDDGLHFNDLGNLIWGAAIRAGLMPLEAREE
jgi:lysophospholipase L1-like esterase